MKKAGNAYTYINSKEDQHERRTIVLPRPTTTPVDWDIVGSGKLNDSNSTVLWHPAEDGLDLSQFKELSPTSVEKRLDMDADPLIDRPNQDDLTFTLTEFTMGSAGDQTIGTYFQARSQHPPGDFRESLLQLRNCLEKTGGSVIPESRESVYQDPRESLTNFFMGAKSDGLGSQGIINSVMKYCREKQASEKAPLPTVQVKEPEKSPPELWKEGRYSEGFGIMDVTAISEAPSSPPYSPPHSTPKRKVGAHTDFHFAPTSRTSSKNEQKSVREIFKEAEKSRSKPYREAEVQHKLSLPEKKEKTISPNSSISSSATSVSNGVSQSRHQLQIYRSQSSTAINLPVQPNENTQSQSIPIFIQVQCCCSNDGKNHKHAREGRTPSPVQAKPAPVQVPAPPQLQPAPVQVPALPQLQPVPVQVPALLQLQQPYMVVPVAMMPMSYATVGMGMPMPVYSSNQPYQAQHQHQAPQNTQCQCRCNSCHN